MQGKTGDGTMRVATKESYDSHCQVCFGWTVSTSYLWSLLALHGNNKEPLAHLESIGVLDGISELVRMISREVELFFSSPSSMKTVKVVRGLSRELVRLRIAVKILELYWARLRNTTTGKIVKGKNSAMMGDVV